MPLCPDMIEDALLMENNENKELPGAPDEKEYSRMDEKEKDISIQKALLRLQNRIYEILYLMEAEMKDKIVGPEEDESKNEKDK